MAINDEHRALLNRISHIGASLDEKRELEARIKEEIISLRGEHRQVERELESLKDLGILYCKSCNDLYEMSDTRVERKEIRITTGTIHLDMERYRDMTEPGTGLLYHCPECDTTLFSRHIPSGNLPRGLDPYDKPDDYPKW